MEETFDSLSCVERREEREEEGGQSRRVEREVFFEGLLTLEEREDEEGEGRGRRRKCGIRREEFGRGGGGEGR